MRVVVAGGTGTVGSEVVNVLSGRGQQVVALTRHPDRAGTPAPGVEYRRAELATGEGLAAALAGAETVVDAAGTGRPGNFDAVVVDGTRRLLDQAAAAGVRHYVGISIVGIDRVSMPYYRAKLRQERVIADGPVPWTVLPATQFHPLVATLLAAVARLGLLPLPRFPLQPVDPGEVGAALAEATLAGPAGRLPPMAGPEVLTLHQLAHEWLRATGRRRLVLPVRIPGRAGRAASAGALCAPERAVGRITFAEWLASRHTLAL